MKLLILKVLTIFCVLAKAKDALIGEEIDEEEYSRLKFCENEVCRDDTNRLLKYIFPNKSINPCLDFTQLACGNFFLERKRDDRYLFVGFDRDWRSSALQLIHKALVEPVHEKDVKSIKVVKGFYQKCIDEDYIVNKSCNDLKSYLNSFGTFPAFAHEDWETTDLNFTKLFEEFNFESLYNYKLVLCSDNPSVKVCVKKLGDDFGIFNNDGTLDHYGLGAYMNMIDTMKSFKIPQEKINASVANYWEFRYGKPLLFEEDIRGISEKPFDFISLDQPEKPEEMFEFTADDFKEKIIEKDWMKLFNLNLPPILNINASDKIKISKRFIDDVVKFETKLDKRIIADGVMLEFLSQNRDFIELEPFDHNDRHQTKRAWPRAEKCGHLIGRKSYMSTAVDALVIRRFIDEERRESFEKIVNMVRDEMIDEAKRMNKSNGESIKKLDMFIAFKDHRVVEDNYQEALYRNLNLDGSENLFETMNGIHLFENFILAQLDHLTEYDRTLLEVAVQFYHTNPTGCVLFSSKNYFFCPWPALIDPAFNVNRSMFFNMAVTNPRIFSNLYSAVGLNANMRNDVSFKTYLKWLKANGEDKHLEGFAFKDENMFWLSLIHVMCKKYPTSEFIGDDLYSDLLIPTSPSNEFFKSFEC